MGYERPVILETGGDELLCDIGNVTLNYRDIINDAMNFYVILKTGESTKRMEKLSSRL
jgi:hypothetical protein